MKGKIAEIEVGVGFMLMLLGAAAADSESLIPTAVLVLVGAAFMLLGRNGVEERYGQNTSYYGDSNVGDLHLHNRDKC